MTQDQWANWLQQEGLNISSDRVQMSRSGQLWHRSKPDCWLEGGTGQFLGANGGTGQYFLRANLFKRESLTYGRTEGEYHA